MHSKESIASTYVSHQSMKEIKVKANKNWDREEKDREID